MSTQHIDSLKPEFVANLIREEVSAGRQTIVWAIFDEEALIISRLISDVPHEVISGATKKADRQRIIRQFKSGELMCVIAKGSLWGFGLNFPNGGAMIFSGWNDSFEEFYQQIRRMVRYGQEKVVRIHIPVIPELEGLQLDNIWRKSENFERDAALQERYYREAILT